MPQLFDPREAAKYDVIVNLSGLRLPNIPVEKLIEWKVADPYNSPIEKYQAARDELERLVMKLILDLRTQSAPGKAPGQSENLYGTITSRTPYNQGTAS